MFKIFDITPLIVFDGGALPSKEQTDKERKERREESLEKGKKFYEQGRRKEAEKYFRQAVSISATMTKTVKNIFFIYFFIYFYLFLLLLLLFFFS